jgi:PPOX class probable F420-dependent enzyme
LAELSQAVRELAGQTILVVLGTKRADGSIQLNPIWFELQNGRFIVNSNTRRTWPANLKRDREATLLLVDREESQRYAQVRARLVEVKPDPDLAVINRLAHRYTDKPFRALEKGEERITFVLEPLAVTGQMI